MLKEPRRLARWAAVASIALTAGIAAFFVSRAWLAPKAPKTPTRAPLPAPPAVVIPESRPDVALADGDGKVRHLSEWDGRPLVINFWATWCAPCRREIPMLNALARDPRYDDVAVIGIAIDFREDVLRYLAETPIEYQVLIGEQDGFDAARAFGVESVMLPFTAFTDRAGRIATVHMGELHRPEADAILAAVRAVDSGEITMQAARERIQAHMRKNDQIGSDSAPLSP
jgi:thiol-disulfide isomerase/thioredoxin